MYNLQTHYRQTVYHYIDKLPIVTVIDRLPLWPPYFMELCTHALWAYCLCIFYLHLPRCSFFAHTDKVSINTVLLHQLGVFAVLYDISFIHDKYLIGVFDS